MAKKKTERKASNSKEATIWQSILKSEKTDFLVGMMIAILAIHLTVSMVSYINTGAEDQSLLENLRPGEWLNHDKIIKNYCGSYGAIISYILITEHFGYAAFLIPCFLFVAGIKTMGIYKLSLWKWFFGMGVSMIWVSIFLAKVLAPLLPEAIFNPGGNHGAVCVNFIENIVGPPGLTALLFFVAIALLTFISKQTITWVRRMFNPLKSITGKASEIVTDKLNNNDSETTSVENGYTASVATSSNTADAKKDTAKSAEPTPVIDLTEFSNLGQKKTSKAQATPVATATPDVKTMKTGDDKLTVEVGKDEKAKGGNLTDDTINTPINPLEPFTRYKHPTLDLLTKDENGSKPYIDMDEIKANNEEIIKVLKSFGIDICEIKATVGPTITLYEITPAEGIRITKIRGLEADIALRLSALGVRIIAPIPGKGTIGIEVPNKKRHNVSMESILNSKKFQETKMELPIALGKTITNEVFMVDLAKLPHLLVAGATGMGKSVGLNVIINSLLYKKHPNELKFVLVDPKKVEFTPYNKIAQHFMACLPENDDEPIITNVQKVVRTLNSLCTLMDHRYDLLKAAGVNKIKDYNALYLNHRLNPNNGHEYMPYIVVIIDEFGDLIMTAGKEVELPIARIAQLARAVGIHMIIATQRPTTSIITGNIKANFPGRMAFRVGAQIDSRTILDRKGADQLIGMGDMLFLNGSEPVRVQCAFIDTEEINAINTYIEDQPGPVEPMELPEPVDVSQGEGASTPREPIADKDPMLNEVARYVVLNQQGSTSSIQRKFSIGYNRAGRIMDLLEQYGIVGAAQGSKPRQVLVNDENQLNSILSDK